MAPASMRMVSPRRGPQWERRRRARLRRMPCPPGQSKRDSAKPDCECSWEQPPSEKRNVWTRTEDREVNDAACSTITRWLAGRRKTTGEIGCGYSLAAAARDRRARLDADGL